MANPSDRDAFSSSEMIRRAKGDLSDAVARSEIDKIVSDLEELSVEVPVAERYPEPIPRIETGRSRRPEPVGRRVPSSYDPTDDPFDRDDVPQRRAVAVAIAVALLVLGAAIAFYAVTPS